MTSNDASRDVVFEYHWLRALVGLIAVLLAVVVALVARLPPNMEPLPSISDSYWLGGRDLFVGALYIVSAFLGAYNGHDTRDFWISKAASLTSFGVALFPTSPLSTDDVLPPYLRAIEPYVSKLHFISAFVLFVCLAVLLVFFLRRARKKLDGLRGGEPGPGSELTISVRLWVYRACLAVMVASMAVGLLYFVGVVTWHRTVFFVELFALLAFGVAWLVSGAYPLFERMKEGSAAPVAG